MQYAIIAAGEGSRLAQESVCVPKPLVEVHGETLINRLVRIFEDNDAEEIVIATRRPLEIHNPRGTRICQVMCETPSSMHSFYRISEFLRGAPFILTTVDTIFNEKEFKDYISAFRKGISKGIDGMMGVTDFIDDEKPLYIKTSPETVGGGSDRIEDFLDSDEDKKCKFISGGIYGLTPDAIKILRKCVWNGQSRMRSFQRALIAAGMNIRLYPFSKILDVDHASDIEKAERFLNGRILGIHRAKEFSPNCVMKDRYVLDRVLKELYYLGFETHCIDEEQIRATSHLPIADMYLSMARSTRVLHLLRGHNTLNNVEGTETCNDRTKLAEAMDQLNIPHPQVLHNPTMADIRNGVWVKKSFGTTLCPSDTTFCSSNEEYTHTLDDFVHRGIDSYIVERHEIGDLIKFYGVTHTSFFRIVYGVDLNGTKFGLEVINGKPHYYKFSRDELQKKVCALAAHIGIRVFGGDAIVHPDGTFSIIDFNDWPSFSVAVEEAVESISSIVRL